MFLSPVFINKLKNIESKAIQEPIRIHNLKKSPEVDSPINNLLRKAHLPAECGQRRPYKFLVVDSANGFKSQERSLSSLD